MEVYHRYSQCMYLYVCDSCASQGVSDALGCDIHQNVDIVKALDNAGG